MKAPVAIILLGLIYLGLSGSIFIVSQVQQAVVLQFGKPVRIIKEPGLKFKLPMVQDVAYFDKRLLEFDAEPKEVITSDRKWVIVDAFVRYRITDPLLLRQTVEDEYGMRNRLSGIVDSSLRQVIGESQLGDLLSPKRQQIVKDLTKVVQVLSSGGRMSDIAEEIKTIDPKQLQSLDQTMTDANGRARGFGIEVVDVRIMRVDLPPENSQAIYRRMQTERDREAKEARAKGEEESQRIKARADRERTITLAEAQKKAQILRGEGDGEASRIFAEAFNKDPAFYEFYRTMQAYRTTFNKDNTRMVISPDSDFMRYMEQGISRGK